MHRFIPQYFDRTWESGIPTLTEEGWKAVGEELGEEGPFSLEEFELPGSSDDTDKESL
jgi:oxysterol-binding protein-related protein 9/10/11